jgi:hypothetical protein
MIELNNFSDDGNGHYSAAFGHDDMVMAEVQLTFVRETLQYKLLRDEFESGFDLTTPDNIYNPFESNMDMDWTPNGYIPQTSYDIYDDYSRIQNDMYRRLSI